MKLNFAVKEFNTLKHIYLELYHCQALSLILFYQMRTFFQISG